MSVMMKMVSTVYQNIMHATASFSRAKDVVLLIIFMAVNCTVILVMGADHMYLY